MAQVQQAAPMYACVGMLAGMLLLGFAGTIVVMTPSAYVAELEQEGAAFVKEASLHFLQDNSRRLQAPLIDPNTQLPVNINPLGGFGFTTTTTMRSAFDSSDTSSSSASSWSSLEPSKSIYSSSSGSFQQSGARAEAWVYTFSTWAGTTWGQLVLMMCFAFFYHKNVVAPIVAREGTLEDKELPHSGEDDFENGICGCFDDPWVIVHGICCPLVRIAHTNAVAGVCGFWETALCCCFCSAISANLGPCCLMVYWRKQVKDVMGIEDHLMNDICCTLFFPGLSLCQQAIAVDRAMGYEVTGFCKLTKVHH